MPLTIDPVIVYTKYFGGSDSNTGGPVATDAQGNVYVSGSTDSIDFPTTNGTKVRLEPPLLAYSNAGQTVTPLPVGTATSVHCRLRELADGKVLYVATPNSIFISGNGGADSFSSQAMPLMNASGNLAQTESRRVISGATPSIHPAHSSPPQHRPFCPLTGAGQEHRRGRPGYGNHRQRHMSTRAAVQISSVNHLVMYATTATPSNLPLHQHRRRRLPRGSNLCPSYPGEPPARSVIHRQFHHPSPLAPGSSDLYRDRWQWRSFQERRWRHDVAEIIQGRYLLDAQVQFCTIDPNNLSNIYVVDAAGIERSTDERRDLHHHFAVAGLQA